MQLTDKPIGKGFLGDYVIVVNEERIGFHLDRANESFRNFASLLRRARSCTDELRNMVPKLSRLIERLRQVDGELSNVRGAGPRRVPVDARLALRPLTRECRLPVAGGRDQQDRAGSGLVQQLEQP